MNTDLKDKLVSLNGKLKNIPFINRGGCGDFAIRVSQYIEHPKFYIIFKYIDEFENHIAGHTCGFHHILTEIDSKFYDSDGFHNKSKFRIYSQSGKHLSGRRGDYAVRISRKKLVELMSDLSDWNPVYWDSKSPKVVERVIRSHFTV